jgi:peptide-methionine (S)-S-oxide reductase
MDAGDVANLQTLLTDHPQLVRERLETPGPWLRDKVGAALDGFFAKPYLLWFIAEDPVRNGKLPPNIAQMAHLIIAAAQQHASSSVRPQVDYALSLVSWSCVARDCGVQLELIDVLVDAGACPDGNTDNALVNANFAAAQHLVQRGAKMTLATALCLERWTNADQLAQTANLKDKQMALVLAALRGKAQALARLIPFGVDLNSPSADLYSHATALHHAVYSGSIDAVRVLVEAGANLDTKDTVHRSTPLGWAEHGKHAEIAAYLREKGARP